MAPFPSFKGNLIGTILETLFYGAYLIVFSQCVTILSQKRLERRPRGYYYLVLTTAILFILITMHLAVNLDRLVIAFTDPSTTPQSFYGNINTFRNKIRLAAYTATTLVSDAFIIYRCFVVYGKRYVFIILPCLLILADIGVGVLTVWSLNEFHIGDSLLAANVTKRVVYFYAITLALNIICTCAMFVVLESIVPLIGLVFSWVIVRVSLGVSHGDASTMIFSGPNKFQTRASRMPAQLQSGVEIHLERIVDTHRDEIDFESGTHSQSKAEMFA
ncbi:hypothetical protein BDQ12DRAFT_665143 [Crucibulum laeve]|uniref:Uncharacterized protein n=1 Tax=Crucibulum laeve TaxID=68775 RepID=A0A5C3M3Z8_9AGAR|nr:hypothetical protein BDQ12DRAFT_665143 [Crucibulum laeve]